MLTSKQVAYVVRNGAATALFCVMFAGSAPVLAGEYDQPLPIAESPLTKLQNFTTRASELAMHAMGMLGISYKMGGNSPEYGLDCSGLVRHVFKQAWGTVLPRTSEEISLVGKRIDNHEMQPGDLVFYNTLKRGFSHVGIYLGDNKFIHSPSAGGQVRIESMDLSYWKARFNGARRIDHPAPG